MSRTTTNIFIYLYIRIDIDEEKEIYRLIKMSFYQIDLIIFSDKIL
mgnify:CR=1 FL=1